MPASTPHGFLKPRDVVLGLQAYPGMTAMSLVSCGSIDLLIFLGIELFGLGAIITACRCPSNHAAKKGWVNLAVIQSLCLVFLLWLGVPIFLQCFVGILQILIGLDTYLMAACVDAATLEAYAANWDPTGPGTLGAATAGPVYINGVRYQAQQTFKVQVPAGAGAGTTLQVTAPGGAVVHVTVPNNKPPGSFFDVLHEAAPVAVAAVTAQPVVAVAAQPVEQVKCLTVTAVAVEVP